MAVAGNSASKICDVAIAGIRVVLEEWDAYDDKGNDTDDPTIITATCVDEQQVMRLKEYLLVRGFTCVPHQRAECLWVELSGRDCTIQVVLDVTSGVRLA